MIYPDRLTEALVDRYRIEREHGQTCPERMPGAA
jgi:hypothetical protein